MILRLVALFIVCSWLGCASKVFKYDKADQALKTEEYDSKVQVKQVEEKKPGEAPPATPAPQVPAPAQPVVDKGKKKKVKTPKVEKEKEKEKETAPVVKEPGPHLPDIEDGAGFKGRRPIKDPFRVGEKVTLNLSYFSIVAGTLELSVKPMVEVNGQKAYHFQVDAKSNSFFNNIYGVDDTAVTYMSYDEMIPLNLQITIKESKQLAEARTFFDWKTLNASYWQKRVTKDKGEESKKLDWKILSYSQNVISAVYYLRTFSWEEGKKYAFRVADEGKNIVFTGEVLRRETLSTDIGELKTIVMRPKVTVDGVFTPVGDITVWLTDDDRKFLVRLETKIKIGTIVAKLKSLEKGRE